MKKDEKVRKPSLSLFLKKKSDQRDTKNDKQKKYIIKIK